MEYQNGSSPPFQNSIVALHVEQGWRASRKILLTDEQSLACSINCFLVSRGKLSKKVQAHRILQEKLHQHRNESNSKYGYAKPCAFSA